MKPPEKKHTTFYRTEGRYNLLDPDEKLVQYIFRFRSDAPKNLQRGFTVNMDRDYHWTEGQIEPLYLAKWLLAEYERYLYSTQLPKLKEVVAYLESIYNQDCDDEHQYNIDYARYQIWYWQDTLDRLTGKAYLTQGAPT